MNNNVNTGGFFSDRLEALIAAALQDGVLTDKERELLKRRAEKEGEDWDEVEMIIEARLAEMQTEKEIVSAATPQMDAIELKDANELTNEGLRYYNSQNYEEAVKRWCKAAEQGHASAQRNLGICYEVGKGVSQNYEEAAKWYRKAAEQGHAIAQFNLGICYEDGIGVSQNYEEAAKWYRKAAEQGDASAQLNLGICYEYGKGVSQNYEEAVKWYRKAAEQGDASAQNALGVCYECGHGVSHNYKEAVRWYHLAAEQGDASAQYNLGEKFYFGRGVPQNDQKAREWWQKAAEQGDQDAIDCLNGKTPEDDEDDKDDSDVHEKTNIFEGDYYEEEKNIVIPEGVTVIAAATCRDFEELENLTLPSTLVTIEYLAFYKCPKLKTVDFTRCKHLKEIGEDAFGYCEKLEKLDLSQCSQLEIVGASSFSNCEKLKSIDIPDSVKSIGMDAFQECNSLKQVFLPASLEEAEKNIFRFCKKLEEIDFSKCTQFKRLSWNSMSSCDNLKKIILPVSLEEIENGTFSHCEKLEEVDFSLSTQLKRIGDEAFYKCEKLLNIVLPDSVTFIGQEAFSYCKALRQVVFPASLEKLEDNVFQFCKLDNLDMSKVTHLSTIPKGFGRTKTMMIPQGVTTIAESAFNNYSYDDNEKLFLPSTLESYGKDNGRWNAIYLYAPQFEDLETLLERNNILYVLPQYLNVYKELWEALGKPNKNAEILPMPDEYLYYYDN